MACTGGRTAGALMIIRKHLGHCGGPGRYSATNHDRA
jgi:hypothetical protein